jgi:hypothetical protein
MSPELAIYRKMLSLISRNLRADIYCYFGPITPPGYSIFLHNFERRTKKKDRVILMLDTPGGSPDAAYRMARLLQRYYSPKGFILYVHRFCKSAGTLMAIGAWELVMADSGELGPLDVQMSKPDELEEQVSGLTPSHAIDAVAKSAFDAFLDAFLRIRSFSGGQITTRTALEIATKLAVGQFQPIYQQIDPMRFGEYQRAMDIGKRYGVRLAGKNLKPEALDRLLSGFPSHSFVIDREEAGYLFNRVREASVEEKELGRWVLTETGKRYRTLNQNSLARETPAQCFAEELFEEGTNDEKETKATKQKPRQPRDTEASRNGNLPREARKSKGSQRKSVPEIPERKPD